MIVFEFIWSNDKIFYSVFFLILLCALINLYSYKISINRYIHYIYDNDKILTLICFIFSTKLTCIVNPSLSIHFLQFHLKDWPFVHNFFNSKTTFLFSFSKSLYCPSSSQIPSKVHTYSVFSLYFYRIFWFFFYELNFWQTSKWP